MPLDTISTVSREWATRPDDQRYTSLLDMEQHFATVRRNSVAQAVSSRRIAFKPTSQHDLTLSLDGGPDISPTHHAFGQLATLARAPAGYLRRLPAPFAADLLNYGLTFDRDIEDVGTLAYQPSSGQGRLRAATGPNYGRIWNHDIVRGLIDRVGDEVSGDWRVPGEFGVRVPVTVENTTLYAADHNMFVFLADEDNRVEIKDRRAGEPGTLARGILIWNSETGDRTLGVVTVLFDYACRNRILWGVKGYDKLVIRHTAGAPDRWIEQVWPAIKAYQESSTKGITDAIEVAKNLRLGDKVDEFLRSRFSATFATAMQNRHMIEEGRPIETIWDAVTAATAVAREIPHQDRRVEVEASAGKILSLVTPA